MPFCPQCGASVEHDADPDDLSERSDHNHSHKHKHELPKGKKSGPIAIPVGGPREPKSEPLPDVHDASDDSDQEDDAFMPKNERGSQSSGESSGERPERRARLQPSALRARTQRLVVRRAMLCQVPGISRVRAEAIVARYPTLRALMAASTVELEALPIKKSPLGRELAVALKRVFE
jgi:hypothetical protein